MPLFNPNIALTAKSFSIASRAVGLTITIPGAVDQVFTGGYYVQGDGGGAQYKRVGAQPPHIGRFQSADGAWWEIFGTEFNPRQFGAKGDGVTDDSDAFIAARSLGKVSVNAGTYKLNKVISTSSDFVMVGDGDNTILDFTGTVTGGSYAIDINGTATQIQNIVGTVNAGATTIPFASAPSLAIGDVFCIYNPTDASWSGFRPDYRAGEYCEVEDISGVNVVLKNPLYDTYNAVNVAIYKITSPKVLLKDFVINGTTVLGLIKPTFCLNAVIDNVKGSHANDCIIYVDRCVNFTITNPELSNVGDGGDDYGICIGNSQHVKVIGGFAYSRRHPVTHGGGSFICSVPVRDSRVIGMTLKNDPASGVIAADYHGNVEDSSFIDCTIYGGAGLGGKNNEFVDCDIFSDNGGRCVYHSEVKGGRLGARGCRFTTYIDPDLSGRAIYDIGGNSTAVTASTNEKTTFYVNDCSVFARNLSATSIFVKFVNSGSTQTMNFDIDKIDFNVNNLGEILRTGLTTGNALSDFIICNNISGLTTPVALHTPVASAYLNFPHRMQKQSGTEVISATTGTALALGTLTNLKYKYPRVPQVYFGGLTQFNGNVAAMPGINAVSATQVRPMVISPNNTNWTATSPVTVSWTTEIFEI